MFGFAQVLAAVVLTSISTAIKYVAASEKADDLKELVKQRKQLETTRANLISADLKMKRNRSLRKAGALGGIATAAAQGDISIFSKEEGELD